MEIVFIVIAALAGFAAAWLFFSRRLADLEAKHASAERLAEELRAQVGAAKQEAAAERAAKEKEQRERVAAQTSLEEARRSVEEQRKAIEEVTARMKETFKALASDTLSDAQRQFLGLAETSFSRIQAEASGDLGKREEAIRGLVDPLAKSVATLQREVSRVEESRQKAYGELTTQVESLQKSSEMLRAETGSLVTSLRQPQIKGKWGELTLRRAVELAGMAAHVDFAEQPTVETDEGRGQRPDLIVHLPGDATIVVDAKVPLHAFLEAIKARTQEDYHSAMENHARLVRTHIAQLASKAYWSQFAAAPDFVVLFLPGESFFSAALEKDPTLIEEAMAKKVVLSSPTTLITLLRSVAQVWRQEQIAENATQIAQLGKELYERLCKFSEHLSKVGRGLDLASKAYEATVSSFETRLLPKAEQLKERGVQAPFDLEAPGRIATSVRQLSAGDEKDEESGERKAG
jgi:DNA recombination protein RmuC